MIGSFSKNVRKLKKANRQSDRKLKKNVTSKSEPYLTNEPFLSYGPNKGNEKWPKSQITRQNTNIGHFSKIKLKFHFTDFIDICKALPFFYAFSGCDTVSSFHGKGKCTMFDHCMTSDIKANLTSIFIRLG